jgi:trehalose 2-sulfotransferase
MEGLSSAAEIRESFANDGVLKSFTTAFSPRCGSTLLTHILTAGGAGRPTEYFQVPYEGNRHFSGKMGEGVTQVFQSIIREHNANGIFSSKIAHDHRAHLDEALAEEILDYEGLDSILPDHRWIFMQRKDVVSQAISLYIAQETGVWHLKGDEINSAAGAIEYDFYSILSKLQTLLANNVNWELFFQKNALRPLIITYEDFLADRKTHLKIIAGHIGIEAESLIDVPPGSDGDLAKISERHKDLYECMRERFVDDFLRVGQRDDRDRLGDSFDSWNSFFSQRLWRSQQGVTQRPTVGPS